jgi:hypothetical protein
MPNTQMSGRCGWDNLSTSKYSYSPPKFSSPTASNLAALLQHHHPAVAMVEKDSRLFQLSKSCVGICTCCFNGCCLACPVEMWKICYKWLGAPLLLMGRSNLVLEQGVSSLNLLTYQMTRFETLEVLEARRKITRAYLFIPCSKCCFTTTSSACNSVQQYAFDFIKPCY